MRTVTFQSVFESVLGRHGLDPFGDAVTHDTAKAVARHITERAETAWMMWRWPELTRTEERAYRQVWNNSVQYHRINEDGLPDEVYYLPTKQYFKAKIGAIDPPVGVNPVGSTSWILLTSVTTFVGRDQFGRLPLGQVIGVYGTDPSLNGNCQSCLDFIPSEKGIKIQCGPPTTVFIQHLMGEPEYTMTPYINGKVYNPDDLVFYFVTGDCYRCLATNSGHVPTDTDFWVLVPVPAMFSTFLKEGAYADSLAETFPTEDQIRLARGAAADTKASQSIEGLIDDLLEQGQKFHYVHPYWSRRTWTYDGTLWWSQQCGNLCHSEPWSGDLVHPLTSVFSASGGTPDAPILPPQSSLIYRPEIDFLLTVDGTPSLQAYPSANLPLDTLIIITIDLAQQSWRIDPGPKDLLDPGQISPADYNVVTNNKHYTKVA